jgi:hypothetical protein
MQFQSIATEMVILFLPNQLELINLGGKSLSIKINSSLIPKMEKLLMQAVTLKANRLSSMLKTILLNRNGKLSILTKLKSQILKVLMTNLVSTSIDHSI